MVLSDITRFLETQAPLAYQEDYDNSGLIVGRPDAEVGSALISLDCTEAVIDEAIRKGCNLVISHHPIVFKGLKKFTGKTYVERVVMKAIKHDVAIYAIHTNLDHVHTGVNARICEVLGIKNYSILSPKGNLLKKLVTFCPLSHADKVRNALFAAGAGNIGNYSECSFNADGFGTFKAGGNTRPFTGNIGEQHHEPEIRIETIFLAEKERPIVLALLEAHPYEEVAYDIYSLANTWQQVGAGMVGWLDAETDEIDFLRMIKQKLRGSVIRHTALRNKKVKKVAVCGGSGSFLLPQAIAAGADVFITADYKYHEFFDADGKIVIADVGHFESEQFTQQLLLEIIQKKFPNFALHLTEENTNPIQYLY
ncbi:Nif3-like dinuclear metal center hexameric protein (plasmid) [Pedobacter sp. BS3]|uniref:Nif3-like dinuclear metal center hexameric protein n=1 Tax=Pedobacter sp. BS3 TaxID=2567937 RepID=UPI0011EC6505|nr:Nif3-like dinuclear metal center hexameric protein [Pedobacter sp. BS3]TZF85928.1 Nif3-like dinuclear metal center hexameric protein [Pedobacter sp. BS3]